MVAIESRQKLAKLKFPKELLNAKGKCKAITKRGRYQP